MVVRMYFEGRKMGAFAYVTVRQDHKAGIRRVLGMACEWRFQQRVFEKTLEAV
jgi:hypothetical protein